MRIWLALILFAGLGLSISGTGAAQESGAAVTDESSVVKDAIEATGEMIKKAQCGLTAPYGDIKAWTSTLEKALKEFENKKQMIENGQTFIKNELEVSKVVQKIIVFYKM